MPGRPLLKTRHTAEEATELAIIRELIQSLRTTKPVFFVPIASICPFLTEKPVWWYKSGGRKGLDISYNCLNLPSHVETADGSSLTYTYLADGTKVSAVSGCGYGLKYRGSFVYETGDSIVVDMPAGMLRDLFFVTDHLGNVRSVVDVSPDLTESVILEQDDYLPFGTRVQNASYAGVEDNRYRYAGKEEQRIGGSDLSLLDFGARY